jgi:DMSO/TMAO reductase YedYZ molybdopterin-dependent catalytic subunit
LSVGERIAQLERRRQQVAAREVHGDRTAAQLGLMLGVAFAICLVTGVVSHLHQSPVDWLPIPATPAGAYRVSQGLHVACGLAAIPLLLAKLYAVSPNLPRWPPVDGPVDAMARLALLPLVGGSIFLLVSGTANIAGWYPWEFFFPTGHWWAAWLVLGATLVHVALQAPVLRRLWWPEQQPDQERAKWYAGDPADPEPAYPESEARAPGSTEGAGEPVSAAGGMSRRALLAVVGAAAGLITLFTAGQTFPPLRSLTALAPRKPDVGPQGFPVNRTAAAARTEGLADDPGYRLVVADPAGNEVALTLERIRTMRQRTHELPIACVEGWSASVVWTGVSLGDVVAAAGLEPPEGDVVVRSAQESGLYRSSVVSASLAGRDDCLLALEANGEPLHEDHGAPIRLIAPNRPGVLQTKWVNRLEVQ